MLMPIITYTSIATIALAIVGIAIMTFLIREQSKREKMIKNMKKNLKIPIDDEIIDFAEKNNIIPIFKKYHEMILECYNNLFNLRIKLSHSREVENSSKIVFKFDIKGTSEEVLLMNDKLLNKVFVEIPIEKRGMFGWSYFIK